MTRTTTPRRKRTEMKAWLYLALFGPGDDADEPTNESTPDTGGTGDTDDGDPPRE